MHTNLRRKVCPPQSGSSMAEARPAACSWVLGSPLEVLAWHLPHVQTTHSAQMQHYALCCAGRLS